MMPITMTIIVVLVGIVIVFVNVSLSCSLRNDPHRVDKQKTITETNEYGEWDILVTLTSCQKVLPALFRIGISLPTKIIIIIIIIVINNTINITTHETSRTAVLGKGVYKESFSHNSGRHSEGLISYKL